MRLLLAGEGPTRKEVEATIATSGLSPNVQVLGFYEEPERLIALADLTVLTSVREGLPRVAVQSLAGGKPVVTTELPGIDAIVQNGINGIVVPSEDLHAAADSIADLLTDRERLSRMQAEAAKIDVSSWSVNAMCTSIESVYEQLMQHQRFASVRGI